MKILVTGAAGFIGSHVVDGFIEAGHDVVAVDDLSRGKVSNIHPKARFHRVDVRSSEMDPLIREERPDVLDHHAAQISVPQSVANPIEDADINLLGLLNLLECAVRHKVKKVIFISSGGAIYGDAGEYPTSESYAPRPLSPYAVSKVASEYYLAFYKHHYALDYTTLRYANIYGPRQVRQGEAGVVAIFMDNIFYGESSVVNHFPEDPEGMIRDYCYVGDVVKANLLSLERGSGDFFNIGTGQETKTLTLYKKSQQVFKSIKGTGLETLAAPLRNLARPGDIPKSCLRIEKAARVLGWRPETDLDQGLRNTLEWRIGQGT